MPFAIKPVEEIQKYVEKIDVAPVVDKVQNTTLDTSSSAFVFLAVIVLYLFRGFFLGLISFIAKMAILAVFAFLGYSLFFI
jgi:hypothetical protein